MALTVAGLACAVATPVEDSMVVTGTVTVNPAGDVQGYTLYEQDKLPQMVRQIVQDTVPHFQFLPIMVDGKAVTAETGMSLRIVVKTTAGAKQGTIRVAAAEFGCDAGRARNLLPDQCPKGTSVSYVRRQSPNYPWAALQARVGGEVFLVLQVDRNGHVSQAAARQVNLYSLTDWPEHYRKILAEASLRAASKWAVHCSDDGSECRKGSLDSTGARQLLDRCAGFRAGKSLRSMERLHSGARTGHPVGGCGRCLRRQLRCDLRWRALHAGCPFRPENHVVERCWTVLTQFVLDVDTVRADHNGRPLDCVDARNTDIHHHRRR